ncbi:Asp-tRNA(Asn)/Glu-tRNA(Gln) amidotransferase subunit GatB [Patescibacteria group bacterium]|nr:Asp-tRNA(Asn)/Glu-tRNA(Gln) amidotransferase subunit GatB [Patescibacteria group bacterium]
MISKEEVIKISKLARLKLSEGEVSKMQKDLSEVFNYFNLLKKAKSQSKAAVFSVGIKNKKEKEESIGIKRITREDRADSQLEPVVKKLIEAAPDKKNSHIKVKSIF